MKFFDLHIKLPFKLNSIKTNIYTETSEEEIT